MTKADLGAVGSFDVLTNHELRETLGHSISHNIREWYRGIDYLGVAGQGNGTGTLTVATTDQGYAWNLKLVSVQLAAAGTLSIYPGENNQTAPIGVVPAVANGPNFEAVETFSGDQIVFKDSRSITLFSSVVILNYRILYKQVPTEMQGKLH